MDCPRDLKRAGNVQQGSRRFLFCDGHDRGVMRTGYSRRTPAHCRSISLQAFTGAEPFSNNKLAAAALAIMAGRRPPRPTHPQFTDQLWTLARHCWDQNPFSRPEVFEVFKILCGRWVFPVIMQSLTLPFSQRSSSHQARHL